MAKEGSTISGLMDTIATMTSIALQYGVPLKALVDKFSHTRFEPSGFTNNPEIPMAKSIMDYVFRWLGNRFCRGGRRRRTSRRRGGVGRPRGDRRRLGRRRSTDGAREARLREPRGRAGLQRVRDHHGAERRLLQVPQLRGHERLQLSRPESWRLESGG